MTKSIADTIHDAIELHLWDGENLLDPKWTAIESGIFATSATKSCQNKAINFIETLGWWHDDFSEFEYGPKRQYARALALTFAELIAKEEGL